MKRNILCQVCLTLLFALGVKAQTDTSSYFPLGLWGIWIDHTHAPFNFTSPYTPIPLSTNQWNTEKNNWSGINGNYMVAWLPV